MKKYFSSYWIRSAFYMILQRFSLSFFGLVNLMILVRSLSDKNDKSRYGIFALFLTTITIFEATKSGLLKNAHIKFVSSNVESPDKTTIASSSFLINIMINIVFVILILFFSPWIAQLLHTGPELVSMLKWYIPGLLCMALFSHFEAVQQSHFDFKGNFAGNFTRQCIFFLIIGFHFLLHIPFSLTHLAIYQSFSIFVGTFVIFLYSRKYLLYRFDPKLIWVKKILGYGGFIFGSGLISNIFANLDQYMSASVLKTPSTVAYYSMASRINTFIDVPSYAATEVIFPKLSQASAEQGPGRVRYLYERMVSVLMSFTIPTALFIILVPGLVVYLIAGPNYQAATPILQLYMVAGLFNPMQNQAANALNSMGKTGLCFLLNIITLIAKLAINYIFLHRMGFYGAAVAQVVSAAFTAIVWYFVMRKQINLHIGSIFRYILDNYKLFYSRGLALLNRKNPTPDTK